MFFSPVKPTNTVDLQWNKSHKCPPQYQLCILMKCRVKSCHTKVGDGTENCLVEDHWMLKNGTLICVICCRLTICKLGEKIPDYVNIDFSENTLTTAVCNMSGKFKLWPVVAQPVIDIWVKREAKVWTFVTEKVAFSLFNINNQYYEACFVKHKMTSNPTNSYNKENHHHG